MSHSTPEAEIVSADLSLRQCGLPSFALWHTLLPHKPKLVLHEDNRTMIRVIETGRNPTMRYLSRTHRVSVAWLHETFSQQEIELVYEVSAKMCADIYTKAFTDASKWIAACDLINIVDPSRLRQFITDCITPPPPVALSSPFVDEPNRHDCDSDVEKIDNDRRLIEVSVIDHNSGHDFNVYPRIIQRGGEVSDTLNSVPKAIKSFYREPLIRTSLTNTHYEAIQNML